MPEDKRSSVVVANVSPCSSSGL